MIEHNNKVYLPLFYPVLFFLSLSGWASQKGDWVIFSSLLYHISILNLIKTFFWPHFPCLLTLCFSPFRAKCFIRIAYHHVSNFHFSHFLFNYPSFWPFLLRYWKTTNVKVSNDWGLLNPMISSYTWSYLTCQKHLTQLISSLVSWINPWQSLLMVPSLFLDLISDWPSSCWQFHPSAQKHLGFSLVIFDSLFISIPHIQSSKKSYWLRLCHPVSHYFSPPHPQPLSSFSWVTAIAS